MAIDLAALRAEIQTDPLALGYSSVDVSGQAGLINEMGLKEQTCPNEQATAQEAAGCIAIDDWRTLTQSDRDYLLALSAIGGINLSDALVVANLQTVFAGTPTLANLGALMVRPCSRAETLFGPGTRVDSSDITAALAG